MYKFKFDTSSKKFYCPECGKKRFVRYVDAENNYLSAELGRCDRQMNCGYWQVPTKDVEFMLKPFDSEIIDFEPTFIDEKIVVHSLTNYHLNGLFVYLTSIFDPLIVEKTFAKYKVGTSKHWGGSTVFWQTDMNGKVRSGKVIKYENGRRVKKPFNHVTWAHKLLGKTDYNLKQVLFGSHLLNTYQGDIVCIVESEKTALIMDMFCPEFLWMSVGSLSMLSYERLIFLHGNYIILYPDTDGFETWYSSAKKISEKLGSTIYVSNLVMNHTLLIDKKEGIDIADLIL